MSDTQPLVTISVVSHGQAALIEMLLQDLDRLDTGDFEVIVTLNIPEDESVYLARTYVAKVLRNPIPKGFGANHNAAFQHCKGAYFAVVNPDIRLTALDWSSLLSPFSQSRVGVVAPKVVSPDGTLEDGVRFFPTFMRLVQRVLLRRRTPDYDWRDAAFEVDWAAGMFLLFRLDAFSRVNGFDEKRYFMYLEDADICKRIWRAGWSVVANPNASVVHAAQRASRNNLRHFRWHAISAFRFLTGL